MPQIPVVPGTDHFHDPAGSLQVTLLPEDLVTPDESDQDRGRMAGRLSRIHSVRRHRLLQPRTRGIQGPSISSQKKGMKQRLMATPSPGAGRTTP